MDVVDAVFGLLFNDTETEVETRKSVGIRKIVLEELVKRGLAAVVISTFTLNLKWEMGVPPYYLPNSNTYGYFPRLLREYAVERKPLALEEAIAKITSVPAERLRLVNRRFIRPGYYADLVVSNLGELEYPLNGYPRKPSKGVKYINGKIAVEGDKLTGAKAGRALLSDIDAA